MDIFLPGVFGVEHIVSFARIIPLVSKYKGVQLWNDAPREGLHDVLASNSEFSVPLPQPGQDTKAQKTGA
jgi:hypothetical protein